MLLFSIYDSKAQAYQTPFGSQTVATALRSFEGAVTEEGHQFNKHAMDYTLFQVGSFDETTGVITPITAVNLGLAAQFLTEVN